MKVRSSALALVVIPVLILVLCAVTLPASAQQLQISKDNKTIAITTSEEAEALPDTAVVSVGFRVYGKDQDATYADASRQSNAIISALTTSGIPKDAIESTQQNLTDIQPGNEADRTRYAQGLRFEFSQQWRVTVDASDAASLLHTAITAGANESGNIEWKLRDENTIQADAARKALENAKQIAARMAQGLGVKLGSLVYATNEAPVAVRSYALSRAPGAVAKKNLAPLAISPEKITRTATVYAVFAIE